MARDDYQRYGRGGSREDYGYGEEMHDQYRSEQPDWGSARSDYGRYAYGGDLDERGVEGRRGHKSRRGFVKRAGDEVRSWFGDETAEHRRELDELRGRYRDRSYYGEPEFETRKPGGRSSMTHHQSQYGYGSDYEQGYGEGGYGKGYLTGEGEVQGESYFRSMSHAGKGPRGWRRPDERILEDVCDLMMQDPDLDASDIEVLVTNGEVIMEGTVESRSAKHLAEDIADSVWGVKDVQNRLRVNDVVNRYTARYPDNPYSM